ncbi:MAG: hypothetical protein IKG65_08050 [Exiguobacterium sp.]|nr:hypothetical protein [Exiguobacterium sp.]
MYLWELLEKRNADESIRIYGYKTYNDFIKDKCGTVRDITNTMDMTGIANCPVTSLEFTNNGINVNIDWSKRRYSMVCMQDEYKWH